jgi:hypothetical protein
MVEDLAEIERKPVWGTYDFLDAGKLVKRFYVIPGLGRPSTRADAEWSLIHQLTSRATKTAISIVVKGLPCSLRQRISRGLVQHWQLRKSRYFAYEPRSMAELNG